MLEGCCAYPNLKFWLFTSINAITQEPTRAQKKRDLNIMKINNLQEKPYQSYSFW